MLDESQVLPTPHSRDAAENGTQYRCTSHQVVEEMYERFRPALVSYVYRVIGSTSDAEDLVQIAFIELMEYLDRGVFIFSVQGWLYRVVHNLAIRYVTKARNLQPIVDTLGVKTEPPVLRRSAEEVVIQHELIERALKVLNPTERHCVMLHAEGLSYKEIAEAVGVASAKAVSIHLVRAFKKLARWKAERR